MGQQKATIPELAHRIWGSGLGEVPLELRKDLRANIAVPAQLQAAHGLAWPVLIRDFSEQGALLELERAQGQLPAVGDQLRLVVATMGEAAVAHETQVQVQHLQQGRLGVSFLSVSKPLLEFLRCEVLIPPHKILPPAQQKALEALQARARQFFAEAMQSWLEGVVAAFDAQIAQAMSDALRQQWRSARQGFKARQEQIAQRFDEYMQPILTHFARPGQAQEASRQAQMRQLSLIDKDEFESWLVVKVMITRIEGRYREHLFALQLRLDQMMGVAAGKQLNPFAALIACDALKYALVGGPLASDVERLIYRAFGERLLEPLGALYEELNAILIRHGVLPELDLARVMVAQKRQEAPGKTPAKPLPEQEQPGQPSASVPEAAPAASSSARMGSAMQEFSALQARARASYATAMRIAELSQWVQEVPEEPAQPLQTASHEDLLASLQKMQAQAVKGTQMVQSLQKNLAHQGQSLNRQDLATCQMVDALLESMTAHDSLAHGVQPWFESLKIPLLKLVLQNEQVFQIDDHPARLVLNRLARLGMRGQVLSVDQRAEIDSMLAEVAVSNPTQDEDFARLLPQLDALVQRQDEVVERNLRRVAQVAESEQKRDLAKQRVDEELDERLAGKHVPRVLMTLLEMGWRDLLVMTHVRHGEQHDEWHQHWSVIDELLARDAQAGSGQLELRELVHRIKEGLHASGANISAEDNKRMGADLKLLLEQDAQAGNIPRVAFPQRQRRAHEEVEDDPALERWRQRCRQLQAGDWVALERPQTAQERMRLAWIGQNHSRFVYVNHQGMRVSDFSLDDMARLLQGGDLNLLEAAPASPVDEAMEKMVQTMYDQLAWAGMHDELTGLFNRREFEHQVEQALAYCRRTRVKHVLAQIDLNQFALVNKDAGYEAGDKLLREMVGLLEAMPHRNKCLARLGGDVFGVLLIDIDPGQAQAQLAVLMQAVADYRFTHADKTFHLGCCIGAVAVSHVDESADMLLRSAESACSIAKETPGGQRMQWWLPDDRDQARRQEVMAWVSRLNQALDEQRLELRCQKIAPLSELAQGDGAHYEVLLSMQGDDGHLISPGEFMQAAERYNRMHAVDRWVIEKVLQWMQEHADKMEALGGFSINLSGHSLNDEGLMEFVFDKFMTYKVPRHKIVFEVTETTAIANLADAADFIHEMKRIGCRFALDDFGAGMSSYSYLKNLPVDFIKIDGSFIKNLDRDKQDWAMVKSIHEMAHMLGKQTIAEYVENEMILAKLTEIGVDFVQGYGIEKPRLLSSL